MNGCATCWPAAPIDGVWPDSSRWAWHVVPRSPAPRGSSADGAHVPASHPRSVRLGRYSPLRSRSIWRFTASKRACIPAVPMRRSTYRSAARHGSGPSHESGQGDFIRGGGLGFSRCPIVQVCNTVKLYSSAVWGLTDTQPRCTTKSSAFNWCKLTKSCTNLLQ